MTTPVSFVTELSFFNSKLTKAHISKLVYAAGTLVPFFLTVESDDEQALGLLTDHSAPDVSIRRKIKSVPGVGDAGGSLVLPGAEDERPIAKAVWTNPPGAHPVGSTQYKRVLYGEMKLPPASTLRPSFEFGDFHMKVRMLPVLLRKFDLLNSFLYSIASICMRL